MESQSHLGIYLRKNKATVACLSQDKERKLLDCFSVEVEDAGEQNQQLLADRIVQACRERKVRFTEAAVALDCASFMQHAVHSEFRDPRKIAATVRFDTEEALATDVSNVAVAFRIASNSEDGSHLDVFTAQRAVLSDIILSLQSNGIDPVSIDPDICCLSRYLLEYVQAKGPVGRSTLYALLSDCRGYLIVRAGTKEVPTLRTFLIGPGQDRTALLARETLVTTALAETAGPVGQLCVFDTSGGISVQTLHEKTGHEVDACDPAGMAGLGPGDADDGSDAVDCAIAYGAALALSEPVSSVNLRNDHMPYLGRKRRVQKAVRFLSISLTILLLAVGVYFHSQLVGVNAQRERLRDKLEIDYLAVMFGEKKLPASMKKAVDNLGSALRHLKAQKTGIGANQEAVSVKLTMVLQALNSCAAQTNLNINTINVTGSGIIIIGDTSSRQNTVNGVYGAIRKAGLRIKQDSVKQEGGRDSFTITVEPEKQPQGT